MRIAVATHVFNFVDFEAYYNHLFCASTWSKKYDLVFIGKVGLQAAVARNGIIEKCIETKCSHVLFLDGDHLVPVEMLDCLVENADKAMVSGLVCKKGEDFQQVCWEIRDTEKGKMYYQVTLPIDGRIYETSVCAFGCTLINIEKLCKLDKPYFRDTCTETGGEIVNLRSDVNLCRMFLDIGEKIFIDTRVLVGHLRNDGSVVYPQNAGIYKRIVELEDDAKRLREGQAGHYWSAKDIRI